MIRLKRKPVGEVRTTNGVTVTDNRYTGQRQEAEIGLYYYVARWYDPVIGHFLQADTIVPEPGSSLSLNRFAYTLYNPIKYTDPSGHKVDQGGGASSMAEIDAQWWTSRQKRIVSRTVKSPSVGKQLSANTSLRWNLLDLVPVVSEVRGIVRGTQTMQAASTQADFLPQQQQLTDWYSNCYGVCHYSEALGGAGQQGSIGGPMPEVPLVDTYSEGMADVVTNAVDLVLFTGLGKEVRGLPEPKINTPTWGIRVAPFGNANKSGPLVSKLPHFHMRFGPELGKSFDGLGFGHHYPWENLDRLFKYLVNPNSFRK